MKIAHVAWREFVATVVTKGFLLGVLLTPVIVLVASGAILLLDESPPKIDGEVAILDPTGRVAERVRGDLRPQAILARREELAKKIEKEIPETLRTLRDRSGTAVEQALETSVETALGQVPIFHVVTLSRAADAEAEKARLLAGSIEDGGRLAVVLVHDNAVVRGAGEAFGAYDLFVREKLDDRISDEIHSAVRNAIIEARVELQGLDVEQIAALTRLPRIRSTTVTKEGERETTEVLNMLLPAAFMILLYGSALTGGQNLLVSTIEEKSSRVVEVLLSAVSPMELMTGKILGQLGVGFLILALYTGMGMSALLSFSLVGLIDGGLFLYLVIFYLIAYFLMASMMSAVGSAVNEMREAQPLMMPIMMTMMVPWLLWLPISRDPNSIFATVTSLLPPINSFCMLLRMTSTTPPPMWQVWLSIAIGLASVYGGLRFAAKVYRIGILMHGKPPDFATLVRWVRMA